MDDGAQCAGEDEEMGFGFEVGDSSGTDGESMSVWGRKRKSKAFEVKTDRGAACLRNKKGTMGNRAGERDKERSPALALRK